MAMAACRCSALLLLLAAVCVKLSQAFVTKSMPALRYSGAIGRKASVCALTMLAKTKSDKLQVLLKSSVEGVGKANEVVQVNNGYFNNFLRPKGLAVIISDEEVRAKEAKERELLAQLKQQAVESATVIKSLGTLIVKRKVGDNGKIFGTVTNKQIIDEIKAKAGAKAEVSTKMKMDLPEIHSVGDYTVSIQLHPEVNVSIPVKVAQE